MSFASNACYPLPHTAFEIWNGLKLNRQILFFMNMGDYNGIASLIGNRVTLAKDINCTKVVLNTI